MSMDEDLL